ncbi:hypothetical protein ASD43_13075 [Microbacterium sp. Root553]|nr:hypothetical protein ASD43_13075 [Microbacterium sp. Root553]
MFVAGVVAAVLGIVLFHVALGRTLRANAADRIPMGGRTKTIPRGSVAMRAAGAGLIVLGAGLMSTGGVLWAVMVILVGPVAALSDRWQRSSRWACTTSECAGQKAEGAPPVGIP